MSRHMLRALAVASLLIAAAPLAEAAPASTPVHVEGGSVIGITSPDGAITRYLGIPFAAPPLGQLRWQPPHPVTPWQGVLEATRFAPGCPQPLPPPGSFYQKEFFLTSERQSEDCLYLNVYRPAHVSTTPLPVMVWFYGGGFVQGSGSLPSFQGDALARKGVILVTINYRLGPLGFLALPELDAESPNHVSGNYGLLDMVAALHWVQANFDGFGGDPKMVTIFGQSAGSTGVGAMMASPLAHELFRRAIDESNPMFGMNDPMQTLAQAEQGGAKFVAALPVHTLAEMRLLPAADLVHTMSTTAAAFGLRPNVDGYVLPKDLPAMIAAPGKNNAEALMIGTNYDEGTELLPATTPDGLVALIHRRFGAQADAIAKLYSGTDGPSATSAQDRMQSDYLMAASATEALVVAKEGKPVFQYRFTRLAPGSDPLTVGAFHSAELAYVFGTQATIPRPWQERDRALAKQMQSYWTNFAKTGDPNGKGLPAWPRFIPEHEVAMELGNTTHPIGILDPTRKSVFDAYLATRLPQ